MHNWLQENPHIRSIRLAASDLNGQARAKRLPVQHADNVIAEGARFPFSVLNLDMRGEDIADSPLVFESGDQDGVVVPTERGFVPMPWLQSPAALLPVWMFHEDGTQFAGDPRHALRHVLERYAELDLRPVCAVELEFFLIDDSGDTLRVPPSPLSGKREGDAEILSLAALDRFEPFVNDLYDGCEAMGIPADAAISEGGMGQFEVNLLHGSDALRMADDAWLFKMLAKGLARKHGFAASFMAKPYADQAGSGLHTHFSILNDQGSNIFDNGELQGSVAMRSAVAGCLQAMAGSTLIFAPHANSYDRMVPSAHAPTGVAWAYENRTAAIRIPGGSPKARRIEHRVAGGDVNPYLMLAAILGAAINGIEDAAQPPAPITGNAYEQDLPQIPSDWASAINAFETDPAVARIFTPELIRNFVLTKRQEISYIPDLTPEERSRLYLETV